MVTCEDVEEEGDDRQSMLRHFLIMGKEPDEEDKSSCTPNSFTPLGRIPLLLLQVLELWPLFPQCEHFLPIILTKTSPPASRANQL